MRLGEPVRLVQDGAGLWAVGRHRAVYFDVASRRPRGGLVAPGLGSVFPVGEEGEDGQD